MGLGCEQTERDTKNKVDKCGGLGYIDMKVALYGISEVVVPCDVASQ